MTPMLFMKKILFWLVIAAAMLYFSESYTLYRMPLSLFLLPLTLIITGVLLYYFTLGARRYLHEKKRDANRLLNILNPVLSVLINAIVLFLLLMLIFNHMLILIGAMTQ